MLAAVDILQYDGVIPKTFVAQLQPTSQTGSGHVQMYARKCEKTMQEEKKQPRTWDDDLAACIVSQQKQPVLNVVPQSVPQMYPHQIVTDPPLVTGAQILPPQSQRRRKQYNGESFEESQHELTIQSQYSTQQTMQERTMHEEESTNEVDYGTSRSGW